MVLRFEYKENVIDRAPLDEQVYYCAKSQKFQAYHLYQETL